MSKISTSYVRQAPVIEHPRVLFIQTGGTIASVKTKKSKIPGSIPWVTKYSYVPMDENLLEHESINADLEAIVVRENIIHEQPFTVDSSTFSPEKWRQIADVVQRHHKEVDAIIVAMGTDRLAETAAASNYWVQNLGKPLIWIGSNKSLYDRGTDARSTILNAFRLAKYDIGEPVILHNRKVYRASRTEKIGSKVPFRSYRIRPLVEFGITHAHFLNGGPVPRSDSSPAFYRRNLRTPFGNLLFDPSVRMFEDRASSNLADLDAFLTSPDVPAVVYIATGDGNVSPEAYDLIDSVKKPVIIGTSLREGPITMENYALGARQLANTHPYVVLGFDMLPSTLYLKTQHAVARYLYEHCSDEQGEPLPLHSQGAGRFRMTQYISNILHTPVNGDITVPT